MTVTVGPHVFDNVDYDDEFDILYLAIGEPPPHTGLHTPEQDTVSVADDDPARVVALDLFYPRRRLERDGEIFITLPDVGRVTVQGAAQVIATARI